MIREIATLEIQAGMEQAFEAAVAQAAPLFQGSDGCHSMALERSIEHPQRYFLRVEWATLEAHTEGFRNSPAFTEWRALVSPFFAQPPSVEHSSETARFF